MLHLTDPLTFGLACAAAFAVGLSKGGLPVIGMMAVPVMSFVMGPLEAAGLLLPIYIVTDMFGLYFYRKEYSPRNLAILVPSAIAGIGIGWAFASVLSQDAVAMVVGMVGLLFCLWRWFGGPSQEKKPAKIIPGIFWGGLSGFTSFVSHSGGPPYQIYTVPQRLPKLVFAGTNTILFAIVNAVKLVPYVALGQMSWATVQTSLVLMPVGALATFVGVRLTRILPEKLFYAFVQAALFLVSLKLVWESGWRLLPH